jgi:signal transduction histidine kinase
VGIAGSTGAILERSLLAMRDIIDRSFLEVRLEAGLVQPQERVSIADLLEEVQIFAGMEAAARGLKLDVKPGEPSLAVTVDRHTLASALSNLLQNAVKYTAPGSTVLLSAHASADRVVIEVEDECGGLPAEDPALLFRPFERRSIDRTGLGLGLSISKRGIEANGGKLDVRNKPGKGCVFIVDLPAAAILAESFAQ